MPKPRILERVSTLEQRTGNLEQQNNTLEGAADLGAVAGATDLDPARERIFTVTATSALTINVTESVPGQSMLLILNNGGSHAITWGMNPRWAGGQPPVLSSRDLIAFICCPDGLWDGVLVSANAQ